MLNKKARILATSVLALLFLQDGGTKDAQICFVVRAPLEQIQKRRNGELWEKAKYHVVEAVPDSVRKEINIISAYIKKATQQAPDAKSPGHTSEAALADTAAKSINQLLSIGLQLPEAMADDTLVAHSIAQKPGNSKPRGLPVEAAQEMTNSQTFGQDVAAQTQGLPVQTAQETEIDTNPRTHTPEQMAQIQEYTASADKGLLDFVEQYAENPNAKFERYTISPVSEQQSQDLFDILGEDFSGYQNAINKNGVNHIIRLHGANGEADQSMSNLDDVSRIGYVLDHYDSVERIYNDDGTFAGSREFRGADNAPAPMVRFAKKIDGTYYVVEAAADNRYKKLWVVSAYMDKSRSITQVPDAAAAAPGGTSETTLASLRSALDQSIPQSSENSKPQGLPIQSAQDAGEQTAQDVGNVQAEENVPISREEVQEAPIDDIPDPGILKQGKRKEGEMKPRLGSETEVRLESTYRTPEEEAALQGQLDAFLDRESEAESVREPLKEGDVIRPVDAESQARMQGQMDALESDSYEIPDIIEQEERAVRIALNEQQAQDQMDAWNAKRQAERQAERIRNGLTLTRRDIVLAQMAAKSGVDTINWEQADNPEPAFLYGKALADVREVDRPLREFMAGRQEELQNNAREAADWIATFAKDKRLGFSYQRETMERNIRDNKIRVTPEMDAKISCAAETFRYGKKAC
ncbi:MAG: hypothetical protein ACI3XZ_02180 [Butyricicoccus sp.]